MSACVLRGPAASEPSLPSTIDDQDIWKYDGNLAGSQCLTHRMQDRDPRFQLEVDLKAQSFT